MMPKPASFLRRGGRAWWGIVLFASSAFAADVVPPVVSSSTQFRPFPIYTDKGTQKGHYVASGYMGDGDLSLSGAYIPTQDGKGPALKVEYRAEGAKGWSGLYWQDPANNWATVAKRSGFDLRGAQRLTFWARGEKGGERIHEFRVGGITGKYPDSDVASIRNVELTSTWKQYTIDLNGKDLRHIIGGFCLMLNKAENGKKAITFYLNDILFEGPAGVFPPAPPEPEVTAVRPSTATAVAAVPVVKGEDLTVKEEAEGLKVSFSRRLQFQSGKALFAEGSTAVLDQVLELLKAYPTNNVLIEGHTDSSGSAGFNLDLSRLRAEAVRDYLIKKAGFAAERFRVVGYGATKPMADNKTAAGRSLNRRVEITILKVIE